MLIPKKERFKPLYKQLIALRENVQNRKKVLNFKKQKWEKFIFYYKGKLLRKYKKRKPYNQTGYIVSRIASKWESYRKNRYNVIVKAYKKFILFYGGFKKYIMKKFIKYAVKKSKGTSLNKFFLELFESRLDTVLYRAKFTRSMRGARQLIAHGKIFVNGNKVRSKLFYLKTGDLISVNWSCNKLVQANIAFANPWPLPPKYLMINYKTLQIIFGSFNGNTNVSTFFSFSLNLEKLLVDYIKR